MSKNQHFTFRLTSSPEEKKLAYALVNESYVRGGLITPRARDVFTSKEGVETIIALTNDGLIVGTVSFGHDTGTGSLPIDLLFSEEVNLMREEKVKICEVTCLATKVGMPITLALSLTREAIHHMIKCGVGYGLAEVAPGHLKLYTDFMFFTKLGEKKLYHSSEGDDWSDSTWWVPIQLDLRDPELYKKQLKEKKLAAYQFYFSQ